MSTVFDDAHRIFLGTHRIQRVSKTDKQNRRHTSFVYVVEVVETEATTIWRDQDIRVDTYRATGPGGQHRNKTDSAVRMIHVPSGIMAVATESRSQQSNRKVAAQRLRARLSTGPSVQDVPHDQQWNWCEWRDTVTDPNGRKRSVTQCLSGKIR